MTKSLDHLPPELTRNRILNSAQSAAFWGVSLMTWRRLYRANKVPAPIQVSAGKYGWRVVDLINALDAKRVA